MPIPNPHAPFVSEAEKNFPRNSLIGVLMIFAAAGIAAIASNWNTVTQQFNNH